MKVSAIQQYRNKVNYNNSNLSAPVMSLPQNTGMSYADAIQSNGNYGKAQVMMKNNPSFGSITLGGAVAVIYWVYMSLLALIAGVTIGSLLKDKYDAKVEEKQRKLEEARIKAQFEQDVIKLANILDMSPKKAQKYHEKFLGASYIPQKGKAMEEVGLNAVRGYSMEKYELMKDVLSPVVLAQKAAKNTMLSNANDKDKIALNTVQENVPNGILLYGPYGTGKTYLAHQIGKHAEQFGSNFVEIKACDINEDKLNEKYNETFKKAENDFIENGKYTFVLLNDQRDALKSQSKAFDTLLNNMEDANKKGIIFIVTINKPTEINPALLRGGRLEKRMHINKMQRFEVADMINYALQCHYIPKEQIAKFDFQKVIDTLNANNWDFTPADYMTFAKNMARQRIVSADEMIEEMKKLTKDQLFAYQYTSERVEEFQQEEKYVKENTPVKKQIEEQGAEDESIV